jgi:hypothetical protein
MPHEPATTPEAILEAYAQAFRRFDHEGVIACLALPCFFASDRDGPPILTSVATEAEARKAIQPIFDWHRRLGVALGRHEVVARADLSDRLACLRLQVTPQDAAGVDLYTFEGVYTFARGDDGWRIAAIAHNQIPVLLARLSA